MTLLSNPYESHSRYHRIYPLIYANYHFKYLFGKSFNEILTSEM